jgi:hypothetical protein
MKKQQGESFHYKSAGLSRHSHALGVTTADNRNPEMLQSSHDFS